MAFQRTIDSWIESTCSAVWRHGGRAGSGAVGAAAGAERRSVARRTMRRCIPTMVAIGIGLGCSSTPPAEAVLPKGTIMAGTLADPMLVHDTKAGVATAIAVLGCKRPERLSPYVREMPSGSPGSRVWRELWIVDGCEKQYPINLRFKENELGTRWTIEDRIAPQL